MSFPSARSRAFVDWTLRHARVLWAVALLLAIPAAWRTATLYFHLRSELEELLPRESPSVRAIEELRARMPGLQHLGVVVDVGDPANLPAGEHFIDDLAARIRSYPPELVHAVRVGNAEERKFLEENAALYTDLDDLKTILQRIEARRDYEVSKQTGASLDEDETPPPLDFSDIEQKYKSKLGDDSRFPNGRFSSKDLHLTMLLVDVGQFSTGRGAGGELLRRVRSDIQALGGIDHYAPGMKVGFAGDVAISVEETSALMADLSTSSIVVVVIVVLVIIAYFRWWRSVLVLMPPLLIAAVFSFALASLPPFNVTELNSNTAFLGSIIIGNGINFGIILLARYVEERRAGGDVRGAVVTAVWGARGGTLSAALAAGVAYASLTLTQFRGFRQFGIIGGIGMVLSWTAAFVLMPPLITWIDKGGKTAPQPVSPRGNLMAPLGWLVARAYRPILIVTALLTVLAVWRVRTLSADEIETDFSKLRRADTWVNGEGYWGRKMDALLGTYLTPTVILTDDVDDARKIATALREAAKKPPLDERIASLRTIDDVLPQEQQAKIDEANAIRDAMTPKLRSLVPPEKRNQIDRLLENDDLHPIAPADLPETFTTGLRERDGSFGKAVLVFPRPSRALWQGQPLADFVATLRDFARLPAQSGHREARVAGSLALSADILASVRKDGAQASIVALLGVMGVVLVILRFGRASAIVIGSLLLAVLWLLAGTMLFNVRINFANFIAYPITFGIGVDYAVNIVSRYVQDGEKDIGAAVRSTGGAVALCSATTITGYSSLLMAENRALYLFGLVAVLGEITCLTTALVTLPSFLEWLHRRKGEEQVTGGTVGGRAGGR